MPSISDPSLPGWVINPRQPPPQSRQKLRASGRKSTESRHRYPCTSVNSVARVRKYQQPGLSWDGLDDKLPNVGSKLHPVPASNLDMKERAQ